MRQKCRSATTEVTYNTPELEVSSHKCKIGDSGGHTKTLAREVRSHRYTKDRKYSRRKLHELRRRKEHKISPNETQTAYTLKSSEYGQPGGSASLHASAWNGRASNRRVLGNAEVLLRKSLWSDMLSFPRLIAISRHSVEAQHG